MARPPKNAAGPSATERMESAFWDCLKEMPFSEITVRDIVTRAKVNRNSYYYHYESMWDLAQAGVAHANFAALARVLLGEPAATDVREADIAAAQAHAGFDHLRVLASENGNQRLLEDAKRAVVDEWLALFKLREDALPDETKAAVDFVFGGFTALLAGGRPGDLDTFVVTIASSPLLADSILMLRNELDPQVDAQIARSQGSRVATRESRIVVERTIEELVVSEREVEEILAEAKNAPVNEVLAPQESALAEGDKTSFEPVIEEVSASTAADGSEIASIEEGSEKAPKATMQADKQEPADFSGDGESAKDLPPSESEQEPAKHISDEACTEQIIESEMHSEAVVEMQQHSELKSTQVPEEETQTQQETEHDNEAVSEQEPVNEAQSQDDLAPAQGVDDVSASEAGQESKPVVDLGQEPVETHESEALPAWEIAEDEPIGVVSAASEFMSEQVTEKTTESVAVYNAARIEVPELANGPASDAVDEQKVPAEPADNGKSASQDEPAAGSKIEDEASDDTDEEPQLSFDFMF